MNERELDLLVAELQDEIKLLRQQRDEAVAMVASHRRFLKSQAKHFLAVLENGPEAAGSDTQSHDDKASY
jgi:hypothetical protein